MAGLLFILLLFLVGVHGQEQTTGNGPTDQELTFFIPNVTAVATEDLKELLGRARSLREAASKEPDAARAVAAAISAAIGTLPPITINQSLRIVKMLPEEVKLYLPGAMDVVARIRRLGTAPVCRERRGRLVPREPSPILIAANLINCEEIMPYWILEVLRLALLYRQDPIMQAVYSVKPELTAPELLDPRKNETQALLRSVAISVYESGSTDNTGLWLQIAQALWTAASVPNTVVVNGFLTRKMEVMDSFTGKLHRQHRIEHLAALRNAALKPLYDKPGAYEHVLFLNDIFFCAPEILRLGLLQADIACGLDVEVWVGGHVPKMKDLATANRGRALRRRLAEAAAAAAAAAAAPASNDTTSTAPITIATATSASSNSSATAVDPVAGPASGNVSAIWQAAVDLMTQVHEEEAARQADADKRIRLARIKPRYEFYDTWVARDIGGRAFIKHDPIARDYRTVEAVHRGLPFAAKCCWHGAVLINATQFSAGLRFRAGMREEGECDASECSIFCEDYRRLGSGRVAVDPSVRVSYTPWTKDFGGPLPGGLPSKVPWSQVRQSGAISQMKKLWQETANDMDFECFPVRKGFDGADLDRVHRVDILRENYTDIFMQRQRMPSPPPVRSCNLVMGPYGAEHEGNVFDDLSFAAWGKNPITRILSRSSEFVDGLQVVYGLTSAKAHGRMGEASMFAADHVEHTVEGGEFVNSAMVYYDERAVHGVELGTNVGRTIVIGDLRQGVMRAKATPCPADPAHEGRYRLIAFAGTADRYLRSVTLIWT